MSPSSLFGGPRILSIWPGLSASPIIKDYLWSPLVQSTVSRNFAILQPSSAKELYDLSSKLTLSGLVAVHLRRGDYKRHCPRLAEWQSLYMGLNQLPTLPDKFDPTPMANQSHSHLEAYYLEHCLPTAEQIVARLHALRIEHPTLSRVYVLTNGWGWWANSLKNELLKDGWDDLKSSLDIQVDSEQHYVAMAVDMAIAEKAEVFVGNGVSFFLSPPFFLNLMWC
jgi:GDP-fucose protein O-fucosyltransferase